MAQEELDQARKRRMTQARKNEEARQAQEQVKVALRSALDNDAYNRLTNIQHVNPQLFMTAAQSILGLAKRVGRPLNDEEARAILGRIRELNETKTEIRFARK